MQKSKQLILMAFAIAVGMHSCLSLLTLFTGFSFLQNLLQTQIYGQIITVKIAFSLILLLMLVVSVYIFLYARENGRMSKQLVQATELGKINIDVMAIEAIALNACKSAQAGIKAAKAKAFCDKNRNLTLTLDCTVFAEVDIPTYMLKIQERVKKDVERYTGLSVKTVVVRVNKVEVAGAKLDGRA